MSPAECAEDIAVHAFWGALDVAIETATADAEAAAKWRSPEVRDLALQALWGLTSLKAELQARVPYAASRMSTRLNREEREDAETQKEAA